MDLMLAIQKDKSVQQLRLSSKATLSLSETMATLAEAYLKDAEIHPYAPGFKPDENGLMEIPFTLPEALQRCARATPANLPELDSKHAADKPPSALVGVEQGSNPRFAFQAVDSSVMLKRGRAIFFNPNGFEVNSLAGILLRARI